MAKKCKFPTCELLGIDRCPHCDRRFCDDHSTEILSSGLFGGVDHTSLDSLTREDRAFVSNLPRREFEAFKAAAHKFARNLACVLCQVRYGKAAIEKLPARPVLPASPGQTYLLLRGNFYDWYTTAEKETAMQARGGHSAVIGEITSLNQAIEFRNNSRHTPSLVAVLLKTVDVGGMRTTITHDEPSGDHRSMVPSTSITAFHPPQVLAAQRSEAFAGTKNGSTWVWETLTAHNALSRLSLEEISALLRL